MMRDGLPVLSGAAAKTGEVTVTFPDSGRRLVLSDASNADLAAWKRSLGEWRRMAAAAERHVDAELVARMDREALWTFRGEGWKLTGSSPKPVVSYRDAEKLRSRLLKLVDEGLITRDAVEAACPVVPARVSVAVGHLAQLEKLGGRVARAVRAYRVERPKRDRSVRAT